jgi:hypothetical protein
MDKLLHGALTADLTELGKTALWSAHGEFAKNFKPFMWCGWEGGLYQHKEAVEHWCRSGVLPFTFLADSESR